MARVVVVGGGISGLATALFVAERHAAAVAEGSLHVELREASERLGGKLLTTPFAGYPAVDEGADAFLARVPAGGDLARRVGLGATLTSPAASKASVWYDGLHDLPEGVVLGVPTGLLAVARSRLLSAKGTLRAALEPLLPRRRDVGDSLGALVRARFGDEVHDRLVDALVGSIYGADTDHFSLAMVPQLATLAASGRSLLLEARAQRRRALPPTGPVFRAPRDGMGVLATATAETAGAAGVEISCGRPVAQVEREGAAWRVDGTPADVVVLASPARATAPLIATAAPDVAAGLATMEHAGVALVTVAVNADVWPKRLGGRSGYLVPKSCQRTVGAVSFGSQKWGHWRGHGEILRISLGRDGVPVDQLDDATLVDRALTETGGHLGLDLQPTAVRISRWPAAFPQYRPGHVAWRSHLERLLPPGLLLTGASYRGIGVPACITDASVTAQQVDEALSR